MTVPYAVKKSILCLTRFFQSSLDTCIEDGPLRVHDIINECPSPSSLVNQEQYLVKLQQKVNRPVKFHPTKKPDASEMAEFKTCSKNNVPGYRPPS